MIDDILQSQVEEPNEEIDFDQLLGDAAQSQADYEEDRDDQDFGDDDDDGENNGNGAKFQSLHTVDFNLTDNTNNMK